MGFAQQSGPPASPKQMAYLKALLVKAGHDDFRTARHEYGLTQRQGGGKFTSKEASALIDRLNGIEPPEPPVQVGRSAEPVDRADRADELTGTRGDLRRGMPGRLTAAELERRGWNVTPPA
jgi:hypothetical protein